MPQNSGGVTILAGNSSGNLQEYCLQQVAKTFKLDNDKDQVRIKKLREIFANAAKGIDG
jgi:hypothetical protein